MLTIKISTSLTSFLTTTIIFCFPAFAESYTAAIQKVIVRGNRLSTDNIIKISSKTNILKLADKIGSTIDNQKKLPKISFLLGSIPFKALEKSLKAKDIKATYSQSNCLSMRSQDDLPINPGISVSPDRNLLSKIMLPVLIADRSFLAQGKGGGSSTGQTNRCQSSTINPVHFRQGTQNLRLSLSKQGYSPISLGFQIIAIEKAQPVLKFDDANLTLEDETSFQSFKFLIDGGSQEIQEQIAKQITKNHPNFYRFNTNQSVKAILSLKNPRRMTGLENSSIHGNGASAPAPSYPDYIIKLNVS
jgi:hypothetical protein